jgi:hypothetical protein
MPGKDWNKIKFYSIMKKFIELSFEEMVEVDGVTFGFEQRLNGLLELLQLLK